MPEIRDVWGDLNHLHHQVGNPQDASRSGEPGDLTVLEKSIGKNPVEVEYLDTPVKSESDKKDYRVIKLPNGMTALLISDIKSISGDKINDDEDQDDNNKREESHPANKENENTKETESGEGNDEKVASDSSNGNVDSAEQERPRNEEKMAACSLCIGVGSFSDPSEIPGLAHFLEHMVFMGSEKYPEENEFMAFIKKHGGYTNASTGNECTTFFFEIQEQRLLPALDRFAQFFISPLMKQDAMTREREAVDSEFQMARTNDFCREGQIFCSLAQPGHPASKFSWGNLVTLRDNVEDEKLYEELRKFRERYYSAHRMTLVIQARFPMDTLEQYVKDCFASVPNNGLPSVDFTQFKGIESFNTPNFKKIYKIKPAADFCEVTLTWTMPPMRHLYKSKPQRYVSWVIGHEGKGSLISYLRKKMWCLDCYSYVRQCCSMFTSFGLTLVLTEDGHKHLKDVLDAVFSYIAMMRGFGSQQRIYDEIRQIRETSFRFIDEISAASYVECLAEDMHLYPPGDYITGSELYTAYNSTEIEACMDALTPDSVNIVILDKKFDDAEFEKVEPWFNTKYTDMEIPKDWIGHWKEIKPFSEFHLPEPNIFITDDFSLVSLPEDVPEYPTKIHSDVMSEVWFRPDPKFKKPECYMDYYFTSPLPLASPQNAASLDLMVLILQQLLAEELYPAGCAGLFSQCCAYEKGIIVSVSGYNQKLPILLATIMNFIANCPTLISTNMFNVMKAQQTKAYYNTFLKPKNLKQDVKFSILMLVHWGIVQKHAAISNLDFTQFQTFVTRFADHIYLKCLVQGNISKEDVIKNAQNCLGILKCRSVLPNTLPEQRTTEIPLGVRCCRLKNFNKADANSVVTNYYQSGIATAKTSAIIELIIMLMDEPVFNQLRTQEQLGYSVHCAMEDTDGILGYSITVCTQADKFTTEYIDDRIEAFVKSFTEILDKTSKEELRTAKLALVKLKQCTDLNLANEYGRNWGEILYGDYRFDRKDREISAINSTTLADMRDWMGKHVLGGENLRKLSIQIIGNPEKKDEIQEESSEENQTVRKSEEITETGKTDEVQEKSIEENQTVKNPEEITETGKEDKVREESGEENETVKKSEEITETGKEDKVQEESSEENQAVKKSEEITETGKEDKVREESGEENETVKNPEEIEEISDICVNELDADSHDSPVESTNDVQSPLEYLTDMPNETTAKPFGYYITDVQHFKNSLYVYPINNNASAYQ